MSDWNNLFWEDLINDLRDPGFRKTYFDQLHDQSYNQGYLDGFDTGYDRGVESEKSKEK